MTEEYFDGYQDALEAILAGVDEGWDYESTINFMEIELAAIARARREAGFSHRVYEGDTNA